LTGQQSNIYSTSKDTRSCLADTNKCEGRNKKRVTKRIKTTEHLRGNISKKNRINVA